MRHGHGDWRSRAILRAVSELQNERARLERLGDRFAPALEDRRVVRRQRDRNGVGAVARTAIWATAVVISVGLVTFWGRDTAEGGLFGRSWSGIAVSEIPSAPSGMPDAIQPRAIIPAAPAVPYNGATAAAAQAPAEPVPPAVAPSPIAPQASLQAQAAQSARPSAEDMLALGLVLTGVRPAPGDGKPRGIVYFDPRCPYCHAAWGDLAGKDVDLVWLPVTALGRENPAASRVAAVVGRAGDGKAALDDAFGATPSSAAMTAELQAKAEENTAGFLALARGWPQEIEGVPAFVIRGKDGKVKVGSGWPPPDRLLE